MQIDGHHTLTYVLARSAGLPHRSAEKIAYCAQYVDEATNTAPIKFSNGAMYDRIVSAHKMIDYRNSVDLANHRVWIPFHFLPGNDLKTHNESVEGPFIKRLICRPDSPIARDMLMMVGRHMDKPYGLHMFGIAMHVYADTFAHQGFAGVMHRANEVDDLDSENALSLLKRISNEISSWGVATFLPLGHGSALSFPDRPYAKWSYIDGFGNRVERDNTEIFIAASNAMYRALRCYQSGDQAVNLQIQDSMPVELENKLRSLFKTINDESGEERHKQWLRKISDGFFEFGPENLSFDISGEQSWKAIARGPNVGTESDPVYEYRESFLLSDWKLFHDALKTYQLELIRDVLPKYGICVA